MTRPRLELLWMERGLIRMAYLLAEYRNTLTGHVHYIPVESCEHAEWVLRCMNHHRKFEFVELYKKEE